MVATVPEGQAAQVPFWQNCPEAQHTLPQACAAGQQVPLTHMSVLPWQQTLLQHAANGAQHVLPQTWLGVKQHVPLRQVPCPWGQHVPSLQTGAPAGQQPFPTQMSFASGQHVPLHEIGGFGPPGSGGQQMPPVEHTSAGSEQHVPLHDTTDAPFTVGQQIPSVVVQVPPKQHTSLQHGAPQQMPPQEVPSPGGQQIPPQLGLSNGQNPAVNDSDGAQQVFKPGVMPGTLGGVMAHLVPVGQQ